MNHYLCDFCQREDWSIAELKAWLSEYSDIEATQHIILELHADQQHQAIIDLVQIYEAVAEARFDLGVKNA